MPSVMQTISGIPASIASRIASAAKGGGTKIDAWRRRRSSSRASATVSKTGRPRWVCAAFAGRDAADDLGAVGDAPARRGRCRLPVMPWQMTLVFLSMRMVIRLGLPSTAATIFCAASSRSSAGDDVEAGLARGSSCPARRWCLRGARPAAP